MPPVATATVAGRNEMITFQEVVTIGDKYGPAMDITDPEKAKEYFEACVQHSMHFFDKTREESEEIERANLGYYAGYYSQETSRRVQELFNCIHPVFGKVADFPTPEEAFEMGKKMGKE